MRKNKKIELAIGFQQALIFLLLATVFSIVAGICANYLYDLFRDNNVHHFIFFISAAVLILFGFFIKDMLKETDKYLEKPKKRKKSKRK